MHPAFSIIFFTITSGLGYGLLFFSGLYVVLDRTGNITESLFSPLVVSSIIGLTLVALGILSSILHLANPKNAWRAFLRFRSSWLSREGVFALLTFPVVFAFIYTIIATETNSVTSKTTAIILMIISLLTVYSTGMIYACLKTIRAWNSPLVPTNYVLLGLLSGALTMFAILNYYNQQSELLLTLIMELLCLAFITKAIYYYFIGKPSELSIKTATGLSSRKVRLLHTGESSKNFLMREFGFDISVKKMLLLRFCSILLMVVMPTLCLITQPASFHFILIAVICNFFGLLLERWLFFAEAKHVVNLYYGREA
jgi:DMSO reductase anchor subunit